MDLEESSMSNVSLLWFIRATKAISFGAFVIQCLEFFNYAPEEIDYLWRTPFRLVTFLYAWCRYFPLCAQLINLTLSEMVHANPRPKLCLIAFTLKAITSQLLTTCVESILMIRVHALYNCNRRTGQFLLAIMIIGMSLEVTGTALSISELQPGPKGTICIPKPSPVENLLIYITGTGLIEGTLLVMTISRVMIYRKTGWMKTPVVSLMLRDGILMFLMLTILVVVIFEMVRNVGVLVWNVAFSLYVALLSIVGCRLVLNMRKLTIEYPRSRQYTEDSTQFSSVFEDDDQCFPASEIHENRSHALTVTS